MIDIANSIGISIVTYNSNNVFRTLDQLITSLVGPYDCHIYIFDNASEESYRAHLREYESDRVSIHWSTTNSGFGHGHNYNIVRSAEPYFLICNPDILIEKEDFDKLFSELVEHPQTMVAPKVTYENGRVQYLIRTRLDVFDYMLRFIPFRFVKKLFNQRLSKFECRELSDEIQTVNFVSGCFMLTYRSDLLEVKGFDERFFMYFEDNDLCQKYRQVNKHILYVPTASVVHFYGKEAHRSFKVFKIFISSMIKYFNKWGWHFF